MTKEDTKLLLKDLCSRLPYGVKVKVTQVPTGLSKNEILTYNRMYSLDESDEYITIKPYLRPMSSMTEEEKREYKHLIAFSGSPNGAANLVDWLNKKMFAYRTIDDKADKDMFELGLAIKVTENNNPYEKDNN